MKFRKKPIVVEAKQFRYIRPNSLNQNMWRGDLVPGMRSAKTLLEHFRNWWRGYPIYYCDTHEGTLMVREGDWVIEGITGEFYPCKPEIFEATYEPAEAYVVRKL